MSTKRLATATALLSSINIIRIGLQFLTIPLLAHLLSPHAYGLSAMAMPIVYISITLSGGGIGQSLIRTPYTDKLTWDACLTVSILSGLLMSIAVLALAPLFGSIAKDGDLTVILAALSSTILFQSIAAIPFTAIQQDQKLYAISLIEFASLAVGVGVLILCAMAGLEVWSFVWQQTSSFFIRMVLTTYFSPYKPRVTTHLQLAKAHLVFGWHSITSNLIPYIGRSVETLLIGRLAGPAALGLYSMAAQLTKTPFLLLNTPIQQILYPRIASQSFPKEKIDRAYLLTIRLLASLLLPTAIIGTLAAKNLFAAVLPPNWQGAASIFAILLPSTTFGGLIGISNTFLLANGDSKAQLRISTEYAILSLCGVAASSWQGVFALSVTCSAMIFIYSIRAQSIYLDSLKCSWHRFVQTIIPALIASSIGGIIYYLVDNLLQPSPIMGSMIALIIFGATASLSIILQIEQIRILTNDLNGDAKTNENHIATKRSSMWLKLRSRL